MSVDRNDEVARLMRKARVFGATADRSDAVVGDIVLGKDGGPMCRVTDDGLEAIVPPVPRVQLAFDGSRSDDWGEVGIVQPSESHVSGMAIRASARTHPMGAEFFDSMPLRPFLAEVQEAVSTLADAYVRPTFFNQPIGVDADGTDVYWSDLVDDNIHPADVRITL